MSVLNKSLLGFLFNGANTVLASAPWKNNVRAIYGFNAAGTGYQVFKPSSNFNSLTQLVQNGSYIVDVATPGFELPGATLVVSSSTSSSTTAVATVTGLSVVPFAPRAGAFRLVFTLEVSGTTDDTFLYFLVDDAYKTIACTGSALIGQAVDNVFDQPYTGPHTLYVVNKAGVSFHAAVQVG